MAERMPKTKLINEISHSVNIRPDVVREVVNSLTDIAVEEIVNNGSFQLDNLVSFKSSEWAGYTAGGGRAIPKHTRLSVKISSGLRKLYKAKASDSSEVITRSNWRDKLKDLTPPRNSTSEPSSSISKKTSEAVEDDDFNPILDEYDE